MHTRGHTHRKREGSWWGQISSFSSEVRRRLSRWQNNGHLHHPKFPWWGLHVNQCQPLSTSWQSWTRRCHTFLAILCSIRGHAEFSPHIPVIHPKVVYSPHIRPGFSTDGSLRDSSFVRIEMLNVMKINTPRGHYGGITLAHGQLSTTSRCFSSTGIWSLLWGVKEGQSLREAC